MALFVWFHDLLRGRERFLASVVAVLTVLACTVLILKDGDTVRSMDEPDFYGIAESVAFRGEFALEPGVPTAYRAPGLSLFYAPFVRMGAGLMEVRLVNAVLVGLSLMLLFELVRRHAGPMAGLFAVAMVPAWPVMIYAATTAYPQTLAAFLLILMLFLIDRLRDWPSGGNTLVAGLAYGALVLTTPITLLLAPIFAVWVWLMAGRKVWNVMIFASVSACLVCSWTVRNYMAFDGAFVPVATSSGYNLLLGNAPEASYNTSTEVPFPDQVYTDITGKNEVERNDIMTAAAMAEIKADPERFIWLYSMKFLHWFHFSNQLVSDKVVEAGASGVNVSTREMILLVTYLAVIAIPLILRLVMIGKIPMRQIELLFLVIWIAAGMAYAMYFTRVRFRLPFDWLIIAGNGMFLATIFQHYVDQARRKSGNFLRAKTEKIG